MCGYLDIHGNRSQDCDGDEQKGISGTAFKHDHQHHRPRQHTTTTF